MFKILQKTLSTGIVTAPYPQRPAAVSESFRGRPEFDLRAWRDARPAAEACPTGAITAQDRHEVRHVTIDYGRCVFCGACAEASQDGAVRMTREFELATADRDSLVVTAEYALNGDGTHHHLQTARDGRSEPEAIGTRVSETIRKVLDAGLEELRQSSYADLTMRAVATRAGVSPASAYTYFPSKSALVAAVYLRLLRELPLHTDNDTTKTRVSATLRDMALVAADEPELATACGAALMADDPAVKPLREQIGDEVSRRIGAALGPGWPRAVKSTLQMTFAGALMTARFVTYQEIAGQLDEAVNLILGASVA